LIVAIFLLAANLRVVLASLPPLLEVIRADLGLSATMAGLLNTLPLVAMGLGAPLAQRLGHHVGREAAVTWSAAAMALGTLLRALGAHPLPLYLGTFVAGCGIAIAGTLLPAMVKEYFSDRAGVVTGSYTFALMGGAAAASGFSVPLARTLDSWADSLASWTVIAAGAFVIWAHITLKMRGGRSHEATVVRPRLPWRSPSAWVVSAFLSANCLVFYSVLTWLPPMYEVDHHWSAAKAGTLLAVSNLIQAPVSLVVPWIGDRVRDRRPLYFLVVGFTLAGLVGLLLVPTVVPWVIALLLGAGIGGAFAMGLVLLVDRADSPAESASLSAMAFLVAFLIGAVGPVVVGGLHDVTGGFRVPLLLLALVAAGQMLLCTSFRPSHRRAQAPRPSESERVVT